MHRMANQMRRMAEEAMSARAVTRHGKVTSYDPANYAVKVELQPDGTLTDWIPLKSMGVGNGWGMFVAPAIGDVFEIDFQEGAGGVPSAGWRFHHNDARPLPVPSGEVWLVHKSGASVKLTNDGGLTLDSGAGASVTLNGGNITSAGTWAHSGTFSANGIGLTTHKHSGVQTGSGTSGAPVA